MKKMILSLGLFTGICVVAASCIKDNSTNVPTVDCSTVTTAAPATEVATLKHYLDSAATSAVLDERGFYYSIDSAVATDSGTHALSCGTVAVTYKGRLLNGGTTFDSTTTPVALYLPNTITGWKEAIPLMKKNATMKLYLPPTLAYGASNVQNNAGVTVIPANSYLIFTITLFDFTNN